MSREVQHQVPRPIAYRSGPAIENPVDAITSIGEDVKRFICPIDVAARMSVNFDLNRYFLADRTNANFAVEIRQNF